VTSDDAAVPQPTHNYAAATRGVQALFEYVRGALSLDPPTRLMSGRELIVSGVGDSVGARESPIT
jgi:hypothetical protein